MYVEQNLTTHFLNYSLSRSRNFRIIFFICINPDMVSIPNKAFLLPAKLAFCACMDHALYPNGNLSLPRLDFKK